MDKHKLIIVMAAALGLTIVLLIANAVLNEDNVKPALQNVIKNNQTVIELSRAVQDNTRFDVRVFAVNISTVTMSDNNKLQEYYQQRYGRKYTPTSKESAQLKSAINDLKEIESSAKLEESYTDSVISLLEQNQSQLQTLMAEDEANHQFFEDIYSHQQGYLATQR